MKTKLIAFSFLLLTFLAACGGQTLPAATEPAPATETVVPPTEAALPTETSAPVAVTQGSASTAVSFANDVMPILQTSCNKCHGIEQVKEGLDMTSYETLMAGSFNGAVITAGNADDSYLVQQILDGEMPKRGPKLTAEQIQLIADWVNQGALNN